MRNEMVGLGLRIIPQNDPGFPRHGIDQGFARVEIKMNSV
jgi:hypothetical protein